VARRLLALATLASALPCAARGRDDPSNVPARPASSLWNDLGFFYESSGMKQ
jgi:hypothetical protein